MTNFDGFTARDDIGGSRNDIFKLEFLIIIDLGSGIDNKKIENVRSELINKFGHKSIFRVNQLCSSSY